ncbi:MULTISPECIES: response regulator transcription factor [unclassified Cryobacterium]|uniref:response regulator transcription factor n=1 Tax=unclassified Cryobacterium TaxID=2649013 RepID=UPI002AB37394|nr:MULTISPECIES: response regulator transcription factor [unclassified Cryobacterium]MDY7542546.1 response regulator transcription factor [Cryobacterium sp. 5B3]MEB0267338.1 response regulator transcription factor [Cryobacterium sp. 10I5]MEB0275175.1 response regulator transcription factor [Cryobacterium sp. 5B3]
MRVLVVEDDGPVASGIIDGLAMAAFESLHVETGRAALAAMTSFEPDLVLLDLGLPDMDGSEVCRGIRSSSQTPIIVVSARDDEIDRVVALEMGADDYVVKPFGMRELVARIRAVSRRTAAGVAAGSGAEAGPGTGDAAGGANGSGGPTDRVLGSLVIDTRTQRVSLAGTEVYFTPTEFDLLVYLSRDAGAVHRRADILHDVWETTWHGTTKTLDAHVAAIRKKLGNPGWIESVRGVGFRFGIPE